MILSNPPYFHVVKQTIKFLLVVFLLICPDSKVWGVDYLPAEPNVFYEAWKSDARIVLIYDNPLAKKEKAARNLFRHPRSLQLAEVKCAMVAIYTMGISVEPDSVKAAQYLKEVENRSYVKWHLGMLYHSLGLYYKYSKLDNVKALEYYQRGKELGNLPCAYSCGFMYYKGLGCKQDYSLAVKYFEDSFDYAGSAFMLGLCYRNGYGVERNDKKAKKCLKAAANKGYQDSKDELAKAEPENHYNISVNRNPISDASAKKHVVPSMKMSLDSIEGTYQGVLATYDWSGVYLIDEQPLTVNIKNKKGKIVGQWIQGKDVIPFEARVDDSGALLFEHTTATLYDRYAHSLEARYRFDTLNVFFLGQGLAGSVSLFSLDEKEPCRPMYISLPKKSGILGDYEADRAESLLTKTTSDADEGHEQPTEDLPVGSHSLYVFCSPTTNQITLRFTIPEESNPINSHNGERRFERSHSLPELDGSDRITVEIYTIDGELMSTFQGGKLTPGSQIMTVAPELPAGKYILILRAGKAKYQSVFHR